MTDAETIAELLRKIRYDCTAIQTKVTDTLNLLARQNLPDTSRPTCPECGITTKGPRTLAEHRYVSHGITIA